MSLISKDVLCALDFAKKLPAWQCNTFTTQVCQWEGITCDTMNSIISLTLYGKGLVGTIPSSLALLTSLQGLVFNSNLLTGTIPRTFGALTNLKTLTLYANSLSGSLPGELCNTPLSMLLTQRNSKMTCYADCLSQIQVHDFGNMLVCPTSSPSLRPTVSPSSSPSLLKFTTSPTATNSNNTVTNPHAIAGPSNNTIPVAVTLCVAFFLAVLCCILFMGFRRYRRHRAMQATSAATTADTSVVEDTTAKTKTNNSMDETATEVSFA